MIIVGEGAVPLAMFAGKVSGLLGVVVFPAFNPKFVLRVPDSMLELLEMPSSTGNTSSGIVPERKSIDIINKPRIPVREGASFDMCMV